MSLSASRRILISSEVLSQEVSGETVLLDLASEQYFGLDPVGTRFWQLLTEERPLSEIVHTMAGEFEVAREELERDLDDLLAKLSEAGLVRMIDAASG